jgi:hypothetical protein
MLPKLPNCPVREASAPDKGVYSLSVIACPRHRARLVRADTGSTGGASLRRANVRHLAFERGADVDSVDRDDGDRVALYRHELQRIARAPLMYRNDDPDIARHKSVLGKVSRQYDLFMLLAHGSLLVTRGLGPGTIVISLGAVVPSSSIHTVRTFGLRPSGLGRGPSTANITPNLECNFVRKGHDRPCVPIRPQDFGS